MTALSVQGLRVRLGSREVLHGLDLKLAPARWTAIVGPNGAGKSTLLKACAGLLPHPGQVRLQGRALGAMTARERARAVAWLAQGGAGASGADDLTVLDVALLGRLPHQGWLAPPGPADHAAVERALRATGAWAWRDRAFGRLSGGERQRVLLARLLAVEADLMLMDEPLANLDPPHQADWIALVRQLVAEGRTVVSVLHEITVALLADDVVVLDAGHVRHAGGAADPATHRALEGVFERRIEVRQLDGRWVALPR
ncbi:ABC transporter ATP-binding protein [Ramlibacter sp. AW1]|uniref:ABC transporter ATP-binding protein n=1 Tax=Ramlibacter aurantiacus TaxID=2801330 RepID=A0A937D330_9BURK|nr:ABC transporter ATP-binding protein [Ramlibacter aurantiacus]MBL0418882.1 ABC transporter ATP-binding protein [Ramlibacter aurantiacus]